MSIVSVGLVICSVGALAVYGFYVFLIKRLEKKFAQDKKTLYEKHQREQKALESLTNSFRIIEPANDNASPLPPTPVEEGRKTFEKLKITLVDQILPPPMKKDSK